MIELDLIQLMVAAHVFMANIAMMRYILHQKDMPLAHAASLLPRSAHDLKELMLYTYAAAYKQSELLCADNTSSSLMRALIVSPDLTHACMLAVGGRHYVVSLNPAGILESSR